MKLIHVIQIQPQITFYIGKSLRLKVTFLNCSYFFFIIIPPKKDIVQHELNCPELSLVKYWVFFFGKAKYISVIITVIFKIIYNLLKLTSDIILKCFRSDSWVLVYQIKLLRTLNGEYDGSCI